MKDKKSVKLFSCIHEDLRSLGSDVESIFGDNDDRIVNDKTLYSYYNMRPTLSDEEKENMSREELINFGDSSPANRLANWRYIRITARALPAFSRVRFCFFLLQTSSY